MTASPTVLQRSIAFEMKRLRLEAGLRQGDLADAAGYSEAAVSRLEKRSLKPNHRMVLALLHAYGRPDLIPHFEEQIGLMRRKNWWEHLLDAKEVSGFDVYLGLEDGASSIDWWEPLAIPGLLQSESHARHTLAGWSATLHPDVVQARIELRHRRQACLTRSDSPVNLWAVTTSYALANLAAPSDVRRDQLDHLREMIQLPNVQLQVVPPNASLGDGNRGPFLILSFDQPDDPGVVYVETQTRGVWFESQAEVTTHTRVMNHLRAAAASPEESVRLIEEHRKESETTV